MPKVVDHDQRRAEIVLALWQVIYLHGIDGVSFRSVAKAAEVSVGRIQHYFSSREEMILDGCRRMVAAAVADHGPTELPEHPRAARAALTAVLSASLSDGDEFRMGASVWAAYQAKAVSSPRIAEIVVDALAERASLLAELVATARAAPGEESASPTEADHAEALHLASLSEGLAHRVLVGAMAASEARRLLDAVVGRCMAAGSASVPCSPGRDGAR